mgnify:CR=1 FL=1
MSTPTTPPQAHARHPLLWLVAIGFFMQTLDATIVNTALPAMAQSLGELIDREDTLLRNILESDRKRK